MTRKPPMPSTAFLGIWAADASQKPSLRSSSVFSPKPLPRSVAPTSASCVICDVRVRGLSGVAGVAEFQLVAPSTGCSVLTNSLLVRSHHLLGKLFPATTRSPRYVSSSIGFLGSIFVASSWLGVTLSPVLASVGRFHFSIGRRFSTLLPDSIGEDPVGGGP